MENTKTPTPATTGDSYEADTRRPVQGGMERKIADVWRETLGVEEVGGDDNFFDLGGHSLAMVKVYDRLQGALAGERLARELTLVEMFEHPTVRALARRLSWKEAEGAEAAELKEMTGGRAQKQKQKQAQQRRQRQHLSAERLDADE
ncbi:MAG TPA: phosphopantetheine-binding protein [Pyrinomonadaceae bacterium]|nr:phosphopantetheine-binding protein [Pyrinomonadaceae bacterium]